MSRMRVPIPLLAFFLAAASFVFSQGAAPAPTSSTNQPSAPAISADAPKMSRETRLQVIRDLETQVVYAHVPFPMGMLGLKLRDGVMSPSAEELQQAMAIYGPSVKQGDPAQISLVQIKGDHIRFEINGGPIRKKKWYQRIEISGGAGVSVSPAAGTGSSDANAHGTFVEVYFDKYVPELSVAQIRVLLLPVLDFNARSKEQAYLDTMLPKVKEAIEQHRVLVGMDGEMVLHAKGRPPKKVREHEGEVSYEEWIYGEPPADVDFVRLVGDEVVRVETMKVGGEKIVRTEKEVELDQKAREAKEQPAEKPANAPTLVRPGEQSPEPLPGMDSDQGSRRQLPPPPPPGAPPSPGDVQIPQLVAQVW